MQFLQADQFCPGLFMDTVLWQKKKKKIKNWDRGTYFPVALKSTKL